MSFTNDEIGELWLLLFLDPSKFTDYEIDRILEHKEGLKNRIHHLWRTFPESLEAVKRYRARKRELAKLPTEELQCIADSINASRTAAPADECDYDPDDGDDSFLGPSLDSDENIVNEILEERKGAEKTATPAG